MVVTSAPSGGGIILTLILIKNILTGLPMTTPSITPRMFLTVLFMVGWFATKLLINQINPIYKCDRNTAAFSRWFCLFSACILSKVLISMDDRGFVLKKSRCLSIKFQNKPSQVFCQSPLL